jgi:hypothetical protein
MQEEGYIAKLLFPEGAKDVLLGSPIAILALDKKDVGGLADWTPAGKKAAAPQA